MKVLWHIVWLCLLPTINAAQTVLPLDADFTGTAVEKPFLYQLQQPSTPLGSPAMLLADSGQWQPVESINYGRRFFAGWARFSVRSEQTRTVWLELTTHFMDSVGVWVSVANAPPQRIYGPSSYREQATPAAPVNHHYFLYALKISAHQAVTVWIGSYVIPGDALKFGVRLWNPTHFLAMQQRDIWGWATFAGIILSILSGVLIGFILYRRYIYLFYACYVLCLSVYSLLNDGWGAFLPDSLAWFDSISTIVHWLSVGLGAFVMFSRRFLTISQGTGLLRFRWPELIPMLVISGAVLLAEWAQHHNQEAVIKWMYFVGYVACAGYGLIWLTYVVTAIRRNSKLVWLLVGAVSTMLVFFIINSFLINFGLIDSQLPDMVVLRIALLLELTILSVGWLYRRKVVQTVRQQLEIQNRQLQADIIQTQESERQRIAADLHDDLGGTLATLRRKIADGRQRFSQADVRATFDALEPLIEQSNADLRRIAHNLMPPEFSRIGLCNALEQLVRSQLPQPTRFSFIRAGVEQKLPLDTELNVYRIVSEQIQNINKHAQASRAAVQVLYYGDKLTVTVEDDGVGSRSTKTDAESEGIGLKNSRLRAEYIGARLWREVGEGGTLVVLDVPYSTTPDAARRPQPNSPD